ncbi:hypothetical protein MPTK1_2g21740 [Marchantia polymorpha subsp. ruderalis]|uniref:Uncharacterized protein n=1 Tax=Marchantia polymorpha TaxID=3197 RepID=A0A2R6X2Q1_MARPO|nr:hypothetical protein MARPO_0040s0041 [Marchantia polymorpha]BBN03221.1 hypothetical protein Mp_2g21740 [Marchantia polymorpha subsp. ruderalis]|eukprot:PTQ40356.1 hypothetical protein MARPO_0040s0041 [Marchantia polymorpha]
MIDIIITSITLLDCTLTSQLDEGYVKLQLRSVKPIIRRAGGSHSFLFADIMVCYDSVRERTTLLRLELSKVSGSSRFGAIVIWRRFWRYPRLLSVAILLNQALTWQTLI